MKAIQLQFIAFISILFKLRFLLVYYSQSKNVMTHWTDPISEMPKNIQETKKALKQAGIQPEVILTQEAEVAVVDVESKVIVVAVECNDLTLGVWSHSLEKYPFVMFYSFDSIFLCLTSELHLKDSDNVVNVKMPHPQNLSLHLM